MTPLFSRKQDAGAGEKTHLDSLQQLKLLATWLDNRFVLPGTKIAFGFDSLIGLIPGIGDVLTGLISLYIFFHAFRHRVSLSTLLAMLANIVVDMVLGTLPVAGDVFDVFFRSNKKNVDLIMKDIEKKVRRARKI